MTSRYGKIARLPLDIREELNTRFANGQTAVSLVPWLNSLPAVQTILKAQFGGVPISEQNLSNWLHGGFCDWGVLLEWRKICEMYADQAGQIVATGFNASGLLLMLTARIAASIPASGVDPDATIPRLPALQALIASVVRICDSERKDARLALDKERLEFQRQKQEAKTAAPAAPSNTSSSSAPSPQSAAGLCPPGPAPQTEGPAPAAHQFIPTELSPNPCPVLPLFPPAAEADLPASPHEELASHLLDLAATPVELPDPAEFGQLPRRQASAR